MGGNTLFINDSYHSRKRVWHRMGKSQHLQFAVIYARLGRHYHSFYTLHLVSQTTKTTPEIPAPFIVYPHSSWFILHLVLRHTCLYGAAYK